MNLQEFMNATSARVSGGSEYQWKCFPNARFMDFADIDGKEVGSCVFNTLTQKIYEVIFSVDEDNVSYRWTDPEWRDSRLEEARSRSIDDGVAYDDVNYTEVQSEDEIMKLALSITNMTYVHSHVPIYDESNDFTPHIPSAEFEKGITDYKVKLTVTQCLGVRATSMEDAVTKAKRFVSSMKPTAELYPDGVCWEDNYYSKEEVSREIEESL